MRRWTVRMVIVSNEEHPDEDPYYGDQQMPMQLAGWIADALYDRDDQPRVVWAEYVQEDT